MIRIHTSAIFGISAFPVEVEVEIRRKGKDQFSIIGLADNAVRESRDRVLTALRRSGFPAPKQILVNLAPAEVKKEGASFDLAIAIGILAATQQVPLNRIESTAFFGELSLDGLLRPVRGAVALSIAMCEEGRTRVIVPLENLNEAGLVPGIEALGCATLRKSVEYLRGGDAVEYSSSGLEAERPRAERNLSQVRGQLAAKRALLIAAAGGHNLLMIGPPGCGKSMLAERFPGILPPLTAVERLQAVKVHSIAGLSIESVLRGVRPFRSPHHVISDIGLVGGGISPRPGEISLCHHGVIFLDEFPEFRRSALEALRAPLETGQVLISRAKGSVILPARFQLLAAMNPCPCGRYGSKIQRCSCTEAMIAGYTKKLSQPILERIDLHVELDEVPLTDITQRFDSEESADDGPLRDQVIDARERQLQLRGALNARLEMNELHQNGGIEPGAMKLLERVAARSIVSARSAVRVLRVARTIADLESNERINERHIAEGVAFRGFEKRLVPSGGAVEDDLCVRR